MNLKSSFSHKISIFNSKKTIYTYLKMVELLLLIMMCYTIFITIVHIRIYSYLLCSNGTSICRINQIIVKFLYRIKKIKISPLTIKNIFT